MRHLALLALIAISSALRAEDLQLDGWTEVPVGGAAEPATRSFYRVQELHGFRIRSEVTHTVSKEHAAENVIDEIEIRRVGEGDAASVKIARTVTLGAGDQGSWSFLNSFGPAYQVYGGVAGRDGVYFAASGERFIAITPKDIGEGRAFWVIMLIADARGVYRLYDKSDAGKYDRIVKE